jgi:hypothetical protein
MHAGAAEAKPRLAFDRKKTFKRRTIHVHTRLVFHLLKVLAVYWSVASSTAKTQSDKALGHDNDSAGEAANFLLRHVRPGYFG